MRNKHTIIISAAVLLLLLLTLFFYLSTFVQPKIIFTAQITKINDEDYNRIKNNTDIRTAGKSIEQFRDISLHIKISTPFALVNHINIGESESQGYIIEPYLKDYLNKLNS